MSKIIVEEFK